MSLTQKAAEVAEFPQPLGAWTRLSETFFHAHMEIQS
jgi:hypothetical protein